MVWIRFQGLLMELFDKQVFTKMGNAVGKAIKFDTSTLSATRDKYASPLR